jgi:hypothetical protein
LCDARGHSARVAAGGRGWRLAPQEKLEATLREMLDAKRAAESPQSIARCVGCVHLFHTFHIANIYQ